MTEFWHSGDGFGDVVYSLPAVRMLGGGTITLFPSAAMPRRMTRERAALLTPLLEAQPYVTRADWAPHGPPPPRATNLDGWRAHVRMAGETLADCHCDALGIPRVSRRETWLTAPDPFREAPVVVARSLAHNHAWMPWRAVHDTYHGRAVFVGLPDEHRAFEQLAGPIPFRPTADFLELARVMAGAELFVGNQSAPLTVAQGLGLRVVLFSPGAGDMDCHLGRPGDVKVTPDTTLPDV